MRGYFYGGHVKKGALVSKTNELWNEIFLKRMLLEDQHFETCEICWTDIYRSDRYMGCPRYWAVNYELLAIKSIVLARVSVQGQI